MRNYQLAREENSKLVFGLSHSCDRMPCAELVRIAGWSPSAVPSLADSIGRARYYTDKGFTITN